MKIQKEQKDFHEIMTNLITKYGLDKVDKYQFLKINIKGTQIKPSELIFSLVVVLFFVFLVYDGAGFICSIGCYLIPTLLCLKQISQQNKKLQVSQKSILNQLSKNNISYTDEQLIKIESAVLEDSNAIVKYIVYFVFYSIFQIMAPLYCILFSDFSWTIIRLVICFFMLYPQTNFGEKLWKDHIEKTLFKNAE